VIAADEAERYGFKLAPLPSGLLEQVHSLFRSDVIALTNPIDLGVIFDFDLYAKIVEECLNALSPDAVLLINSYSLDEAVGARRLAKRVEEIVRESERPIALCVYSQGDERQKTQQELSLPVFAEIEDALRGLAASRDWNHRHPRGDQANTYATSAPKERQLFTEPGVLLPDQALSICQEYGIPVAPFVVANNLEEAVHAADKLGYPVALKALSKELLHKSDVGAVALGLTNAQAVKQQGTAMMERIASPVKLMVQRMFSGGLEVILGGKRDRSFGPVVMFGLGGIYVEVLGDVALRVAPITRADAEEMISEIRGRRLLEGARGKPPLDREILVKALMSLSEMLVENPDLAEIDINPLLVLDRGAVALDARAVVKKTL
jgi:acetyltransferase